VVVGGALHFVQVRYFYTGLKKSVGATAVAVAFTTCGRLVVEAKAASAHMELHGLSGGDLNGSLNICACAAITDVAVSMVDAAAVAALDLKPHVGGTFGDSYFFVALFIICTICGNCLACFEVIEVLAGVN